MSRFIDPIPIEFQPSVEDNFYSEPIIRAVKSREMIPQNFIPTYIERNPVGKSFVCGQDENASYFSLSVFTDKKSCESALSKYPKSFRKFIGYAIGRTNIEKGIALEPAKNHIDYFLYDYANNSPAEDFEYLEDIKHG